MYSINKFFLVIILIIYGALASANITEQLKNYQSDISPRVKVILDKFADNNASLSFLEMQMASYTASRVGEWEIAGFYYIAAPIIRNLMSLSVVYESPLTAKGKKEIKQSRAKMYSLLNSVKKDKRFKRYYKDRHKIITTDPNRDVQLKLINNPEVLLKSVELYKQWEFKLSNNYSYILSVASRKSDQEIAQTFNQLNVDYLKASQDIIKLLEIPGYKELKLKSIDYMDEYSEILINQRQPGMNWMMQFGKLKQEIEKVEMDNLLFPDANSISWF